MRIDNTDTGDGIIKLISAIIFIYLSAAMTTGNITGWAYDVGLIILPIWLICVCVMTFTD